MISILFGAGASFGSDRFNITPPLGDKLFPALEALGGEFSILNVEQKDAFARYGFEKGMDCIENDSRIINPLQREIALYLSGFMPSQRNAYVKLFRALKDVMNDIQLITLNYDMLIEAALLNNGHRRVKYGLNDGDGTSLLKVHGSSNFVPDTGGNNLKIVAVDCDSFADFNSTIALTSTQDLKDWCEDPLNQSLSPVLCMYNKEKRVVMNEGFLNTARVAYNKAINKSTAIVIVGVKYIPHDEHIWDSILQADAEIIVVDPYPEPAFIEVLKNKKKKHRLIRNSFSDVTKILAREIKDRIAGFQNSSTGRVNG